jgi:hypothetical protein
MPYIKAEARPDLDRRMEALIAHIRTLPVEEQDGALNYTVSRMIMSIYPLRYFHINRVMGVLECIKQEFYRVVAGPYEDEKIKENGPVQRQA